MNGIQLALPFTYCDEAMYKFSEPEYLLRKHDVFGLNYCRTAFFSGKYGIPKIKPYIGDIPEHFITFSECLNMKNCNYGVSCFDYDYVLERLWNNAPRYVERLSKFPCVGSPDFSLKILHPLAVQIANIYRNHAVAYYLQEHNVKVLPSIAWSNFLSYEFCFDGFSKGGRIMVSTIGTLCDERSWIYFRNGFNEMLKQISPDSIVIYGDSNDRIMSIIPSQLEVINVVHNRYKKMRNHGK